MSCRPFLLRPSRTCLAPTTTGSSTGSRPLPDDDRPLLVLHGNCQAESLRLLLQRAPQAPCLSVRIPPLHEIAVDEIHCLERLLARCAVLLTQPVADGYHDLRPPAVPHHDLRTVLRAAGLPSAPPLDSAHLDTVTTWSTQALRQEKAADAVPVHNLLRAARTRAANTINHPGNPVLVGMARRVQRTLAWPETAVDPGYEMLGSVLAPLEREVRDAVDPDADSRPDWMVDGLPVTDASIAAAQLGWYRERPDVVRVVLSRAAEQLQCLGVDRRPT